MKTYDPSQVQALFGDHIGGGFVRGTFITVELDEDRYSFVSGISGEGTRTKNVTDSGKITVKVYSSSDSNDYYTSMYLADRLNNGGIRPFMMKDGSGRSLAAAASIWVEKTPPLEKSNEITENEWVFRSDAISMFIGGN